jgi:O-methyltransferase involved in polyketide biosynthesis
MKTETYYAEVRKLRARLDEQFPQGHCLLTSVANRDKGTVAGNVTEADNSNAARCIAEATHRIATEAEVAEWHEHHERNRQQARTTEYLRDGQRVVWGGGVR